MTQQLTTIDPEAYEGMTNDLEAAITEFNYMGAVLTVEKYHALGGIIRQYTKEDSITAYVEKWATDRGVSTRTVWRYVEVYDKAPEENGAQKIIEQYGKNISVTRLISPKTDEKEEEREKCPTCHRLMPLK